jgi:hypothetical protein
MSEASYDFSGGLLAAVQRAPIWFAGGALLGVALSALFISNASEIRTSEIVVNIQVGQYWPKVGISQPLEHPKRSVETLKQTVLDRKDSQTHIQSYSYATSSDPWGVVLTVLSKDPKATRGALEEAVGTLVGKQNDRYDRIASLFEKKMGSLEAEQKAIAEAVRESLSQSANIKSTALSSMIARSIMTNNELAQIETGLLADPAHFLRTQYFISEHPKTLGRLRIVLMIAVGLCLSIGLGFLSSRIGGSLKSAKQP